jgi:hypothetical protein
MKLLSSVWVFVPVALIGLCGGIVWWTFWGCTDSCPINSSWVISALRGGLIAAAVGMVFLPLKSSKKEESHK